MCFNIKVFVSRLIMQEVDLVRALLLQWGSDSQKIYLMCFNKSIGFTILEHFPYGEGRWAQLLVYTTYLRIIKLATKFLYSHAF
jgi:hypothetical protein